MFSFHATKVFHTIEGGCVTTADPELNRRLEWERNYGIEDEETVLYPGRQRQNERVPRRHGPVQPAPSG